jgi:hypothetical protein
MKIRNYNYYLTKKQTNICDCGNEFWCEKCLIKKVNGDVYVGKGENHELAIKLSNV